MKKLNLVFAIAIMALAIISCKKDKDDSALTQDVSFSAIQIDPSAGLKSSEEWICPTDNNGNMLVPTVAKVVIAGIAEPFWPAVFEIDGKLYTQAIKLPVLTDQQDYTVTFFGLFANKTDANPIMATPTAGSHYAAYTNTDVSFSIRITKFAKAEIPVEVLCYMPESYSYFGFDWFEVDQIVIRNQCFFGDFCMKHPDDYTGSSYENQAGPLQLDMPAIFKIDARKYVQGQWVELPYNSTFTNNTAEANWGVGAPVCVQYPDNLMISGEQFKFELWILVKVGSAFEYKLFHTWLFEDDDMITAGTDKVVDFVLGSCNLTDTDLQLAPYQNLPVNCTLTVGNGTVPGDQGAYFDVTLSGIGTGFDIANGPVGVYCADQGHTIYGGSTHIMGVYSSLYPLTIPTAFMEPQAIANLDRANWLINHLGNFPGATWADIQNALWIILDAQATFPHSGVPYNALATTMANAAATNGNNYVPLPGGWAAVVFATSGDVQIIFTIVDP